MNGMNGSRRGWMALSLVGALGALALVGCPKKSDDSSKKEEVTKDDDGKKKKGDDDDESEGAYADGDVLEHVPQKCAMGRFYVNFGAIVKDPAVKPLMKKLDDKIVESLKGKDGEKFEAAMKALHDGGINPARDVHEFAMCMRSKKDMVLAIGGDLGTDPLGALQKAVVAGDEPKPKKKTESGVDYLASEKVNIGLVTPNVLVFAEDLDEMVSMKKKQSVSDDWQADKGRLLALDVKAVEKNMDIKATLTEDGDDIQAKAAMELSGDDAKKMKSDPTNFAKGIKQAVQKFAEKLDGTPLEAIGEDLKDVKVKIDGNTVNITTKISNKHLASALKKIMESSEEDLENAFK